MASINLIKGNILDSKDQCIIHQGNCESSYAKGLAKSIFDKFPYADVYSRVRTPGTCIIVKPEDVKSSNNQSHKPVVACIFGQCNRGKPSATDSYEQRKKWFSEGLEHFHKQASDIKSIAIPWGIGCGLAGGEWEDYLRLIIDFFKGKNYVVNFYKFD